MEISFKESFILKIKNMIFELTYDETMNLKNLLNDMEELSKLPTENDWANMDTTQRREWAKNATEQERIAMQYRGWKE